MNGSLVIVAERGAINPRLAIRCESTLVLSAAPNSALFALSISISTNANKISYGVFRGLEWCRGRSSWACTNRRVICTMKKLRRSYALQIETLLPGRFSSAILAVSLFIFDEHLYVLSPESNVTARDECAAAWIRSESFPAHIANFGAPA
jgi:hypothetical protein